MAERQLVNVGDYAVTPFEPVGLVKVVELYAEARPYGETAKVLYLHEHYGYAAGTHGLYPRAELKHVDAVIVDIIDECILASLGLKEACV